MSAVDRSPRATILGLSKPSDLVMSTGERTPKLLAVGGILAALGMAACCVAPFALFSLGVSGAWIGNLTSLRPYQPIFIGLGVASIGYGFYLVYRQPKVVCEDVSWCASPRSGRVAKVGLWLATALVIGALGVPYAVRYFLDT
jgi:mercuric ion transport protein